MFVKTSSLTMYCEEHGRGDPLILLHGGTDTCRYWDPVMPYLTPHFRVITPDSRGHGRTDNPAGTLSYPQMAEDVLALVEALGLTRPAIGGWSDGGQIALEIGIRYPDAARALVVGGAGYRYSEDYVREIRQGTFTREDGTVDVDAWEAANPEGARSMRQAHRHVYGSEHWKNVLRWCAKLWLTPFGLTAADFAKITAPTVLMNGDRDPYFPVEETVEMFRMIAPAEMTIFPGADHSVPLTQPEAFARTLITFLERHPVPSG
jgi:pimeloyl-ACP methyl ester carboxylesterase